MSISLIIPVIFTLTLSSTKTAKILGVFPVPSISHQVVFRTLTQELAKQGHEVTVITPNPAFPNGGATLNLTEVSVQDSSYKIWRENFISKSKGEKGNLSKQLKILLDSFTIVFDAQLKIEEVRKILNLNDRYYDLLLIEACVRPALVFSHIFKAPVILVSSLGAAPGNYKLLGASEHPILHPSVFTQRNYNLNTWEKITELYNHYQIINTYQKSVVKENQILRRHFGSKVPSVEELEHNVNLLLLNSNPVFEGIRAVPPNVIYMGGVHQNPAKPLPVDLKKYLDSSKNGVVYVSFGTNVDSTLLPAERVQILVRVFSKLPYDVLFKWDNEELPGRGDNIKISKWLPQSDLLGHPKIKLFITQGGLQSTDEAITSGVPLIGIPMLADQWYNTEKYVYHNIGMQLGLETLTEEQLRDAINTIIGDESYRNNVVKLRTLMLDQPMKPLERAIWWIEHVIRHGGAKHLRHPAANMSWWQYLELELVLTVLTALLFIVTILVSGILLLYKYLFRSPIESSVKLKRK